MTRFYRFPDAETALDLLGIATAAGRIIPCDMMVDGVCVAIDVLYGTGVITRRIGGTDEAPEYEALDGFHVNTSHDVPGLSEYEVAPDDPVCVFTNLQAFRHE